MRLLYLLSLVVITGCAGGPTKDYYNPAIIGARYKGPIVSELVDDVGKERDRLKSESYTVIGSTEYFGKYPEAKELRAQAKRVGANRVVYSCSRIPAPPGSWSFRLVGRVASGGSADDRFDVKIVFLGK